MAHILLTNAKRVTARSTPEIPPDAHYDLDAGVWRVGENLLARDPVGVRVSKKADIETGEDRKGE